MITGGALIDGTGSPARPATVVVEDGRVRVLPPDAAPRSRQEIDARGLVVCPGFVDIHTHSDLSLLAAPGADSKVRQGVTTEVVGNCGLGMAPTAAGTSTETRDQIRAAVGYLDVDPELDVRWTSVAEYLSAVEAASPALNVATLVPHLPVHASVVGFSEEPPTTAQIDRMCALVSEGLTQGAAGFSTGIAYTPLCFATDDEMLAIGQTVADAGGLFAWHVRDYGDGLVPSVEQALAVARKTGCRTQISHLAAVGRRNWGRVRDVLDMVERAWAEGLDVGVDAYPYLAGNAPLSQLLPDWAQTGDASRWQPALAEADIRRRVADAWATELALGWEDITVLLPDRPATDAPSAAALADERGRAPDEVVLDLLVAHGSSLDMIARGRSPRDLATVLRHPATVVASDGMALNPSGLTGEIPAHPRSYGCFPAYLTGDTAAADLPTAIQRCTQAPADRVGLSDRGRLADGMAADVLVVDLVRLSARATFDNPHQLAQGIDWVLVNGQVVHGPAGETTSGAGRVLRSHSGDPTS